MFQPRCQCTRENLQEVADKGKKCGINHRAYLTATWNILQGTTPCKKIWWHCCTKSTQLLLIWGYFFLSSFFCFLMAWLTRRIWNTSYVRPIRIRNIPLPHRFKAEGYFNENLKCHVQVRCSRRYTFTVKHTCSSPSLTT